MALENEVAALVTSTTALQNEVGSQLAKVRAENTTLKTELATRIDTQYLFANGVRSPRVVVGKESWAPLYFENTSKVGVDITRSRLYGFMNVGVGESGIGQWDGFSIYNYKFEALSSPGPSSVTTPLTIFDNNSFSIGGSQPGQMALHSFAIGSTALSASLQFTNTVGLGMGANVTGNNQIQLGNSTVTVYSHNALQTRSDQRDKVDVRPTNLGLNFIKALNPVDFRWDTRDSYRPTMPLMPIFPPEEASEIEKRDYDSAMTSYNTTLREWKEASKIENLKPDGSKKRSRYHHGLIAQQVEDLIRITGVDFGGFQDHKRSGGQDVLSIGYDELIAPLIKAVQELAQANEDLRSRISTLEAGK